MTNIDNDQLRMKLETFKKETWIPVVEPMREHGRVLSSKFSGIAYIPKGEEWPKCGHCGQEMQLFLQLNAKDIPSETPNSFGEGGVLQVFYCTNAEAGCEIKCESFFPFSKATLVRIIFPNNQESEVYEYSPVEDAFPEMRISGWQAQLDYPNWEELDELGVELTDEEHDLLDEFGIPTLGDKLLGWPHWIQGIEYPNCPECHVPMKLLFQIDSEDNIPYMFGDAGCAYVTQCENHPHVLTIAWACS